MKKEKFKRLAQTIIKHIIIKWTFDVIDTSVATIDFFCNFSHDFEEFKKLNIKLII